MKLLSFAVKKESATGAQRRGFVFLFLAAAVLLFARPSLANAAACSVNISSAPSSLTNGDYASVSASGGLVGTVNCMKNSYTYVCSHTLTLSSSGSGNLQVLSPDSDSGDSPAGSLNTTVYGTSAGRATLTAGFSYTTADGSGGCSTTTTVTVKPFVPVYTPLQSAAASPLRLAYGTLNSDGSIANGSGLSSNGTGGAGHAGLYGIAYAPASSFAIAPTVIASIYGNNTDTISPTNESAAGTEMQIWEFGGNRSATDSGFAFLAVGQDEVGGSTCAFVSPSSNQVLVRGSVGFDSGYAVATAGKGYIVSRILSGLYNVSFLIPFASAPVVLVANDTGDYYVVNASNITANGFTIYTYNRGDLTTPADASFTFIAIGTSPQALSTGCPVNTLEAQPLKLVRASFTASGMVDTNRGDGVLGVLLDYSGGKGVYNLQYYPYTNPFIDIATPLATNDEQTVAYVGTAGDSASTVTVKTFDRREQNWFAEDMPFEFVAVGPIAAAPPLSATCSASSPSVKSGDAATFTASPSGGAGGYSYKWGYPNGLAACPNSDSTQNAFGSYQICTSAPLSSNLSAGDFNISVNDSSGGQASANCPAVNVAAAAATTLSASFLDTINSGAQTTISTTTAAGQQTSIPLYVRNVGPASSSMRWDCKIDPLYLASHTELGLSYCSSTPRAIPGGQPPF